LANVIHPHVAVKTAVALSIGLWVVGSRSVSAADQPAAPEPAFDAAGAGEGERDELGLTPADYAASLDYDTTYDDAVAQAYDDGYSEDASLTFHDTLAPYGRWVDDPAYGQVWVPAASIVGQDFSPYATNGDWVDTEYGWTWVSGWTWGWGPFHYGRWTTIDGHGWAWVPGTIWGPAWVAWRAGAGCVGWAPLPPRGVALGTPLGAHSPWRFVGASSFGKSHAVYLPTSAVPRVFGQMSVVSNARRIGTGRTAVTVNVGPSLRGWAAAGAGAARLASVAPGVLPRVAVQPRSGLAIERRAWVRAGVTRQLAFPPAATATVVRGGVTRGSLGLLGRPARPSPTMTGRGPVGPARSFVGATPAFDRTAGGHVAVPAEHSFLGRPPSGGSYGSYVPLSRRSASFAPPAVTPASPAPVWRSSAPRFAAPTAPFTAPTAPFTAPTAGFTAPTGGFTGSVPSSGGARSAFGGGPARSFGGGHPSFRGSGGHRR